MKNEVAVRPLMAYHFYLSSSTVAFFDHRRLVEGGSEGGLSF